MGPELRRGEAADAGRLGDICYRAFRDIAERHGFIPDFPSAESAAGLMQHLIADPRTYDVVAVQDGQLIGSNFLGEYGPIAGVGPISVDPAVQNDGAGRAMMADVLSRTAERGFAGVRLVQAGYHSRTLALYSKLGFDARAQLACFHGPPLGLSVPGCAVRAATEADLAACDRLCLEVHGHTRGELAGATSRGTARVVERAGRITGYATALAFSGHAVGETNDDLKALIGAAEALVAPGILVPTRNGPLMRWALEAGLRITQTLTLMSIGLYNEPAGAWLPSVVF